MMGKKICSQELAVLSAMRTGQWSESLQDHLAACPDCHEAVLTARVLQSFAASSATETPMPDATRLWCLALLEEKQRAVAHARRSLVAVEIATIALLGAGISGWVAWSWPEIEAQLTAWQTRLWLQLWQAAWFLAQPMPVLASWPAAVVLLLLVAAVFLLGQPLLAKD